jgi:16S rRNA (cytidine1402-2'-O)-methyltransferase
LARIVAPRSADWSAIIVSTAGILYVVATPIGNLADISVRARDVLGRVAAVAAEDTRHTGRLLASLGISRPLVPLHEHNERRSAARLLRRLQEGDDIALVSDAGTPLVSDPGFRLLRSAVDAGVPVVAVPGACAAIAALSVAGLPTDRFCFEGFLPARATARQARLAGLADEPRTMVFHEAPQRLQAFLADAAAALGGARRAAVLRELTKLHESAYHGTLDELAARAGRDADMQRGEIVVVVSGASEGRREAGADLDRVLQVLLKSLAPSQAATAAAELTGARRNDCYRRALALSRGPVRGTDHDRDTALE